MAEHINKYFKAVCEAYKLGNTESVYIQHIITLLTQFGCAARDTSGERGGQMGENIDIKLWRDETDVTETEPFAGIEVKKIDGIDVRAASQIKTEADRYGNVILTDNLIWQFWRSGEEKMYSGIRLIDKKDGKLELRHDNVELFINLIEDFILAAPAQIRSSDKLAEYMAMHARTIRSVITGILKDDGSGFPLVDERQKKLPMFPELYGLYNKIKTDLRPAMTTRDFADMYAQTIVYGLFIARHNNRTPETFNRYEAIKDLQEESELLRQFFMHIAGSGKKHPTLEGVIDKLCSLYQLCDISDILSHDDNKDAVVHFYEEFLTFYDPALRKSLGVFYTPIQAVRYLVWAVDDILVKDFNIQGGLSCNDQVSIMTPSAPYQDSKKKWRDKKEISVPRVAILDPACGTGSFGAEIIRHIKAKYFSGAREAFYKNYIQSENGLLSRLIGFEIMMTSYVVAHLKIRRAIDETIGCASDTQLPANIFLTNTLAPPHSSLERTEQITLFDFSAAITDEAYHADTWKTRRPIKVIIGNPPYLAASVNQYDISAYKTETDGITKLQEKNSKWLGDDYVKFFRFSEQIINENKEGILAFVSNNGFLDNPTFRGMRASLLRTFDKIYIINLHGNAKKNEIAPDGSKDENIFDIMQGVSLFVGIKTTINQSWAKVFYADLWGTRENKFEHLKQRDVEFSQVNSDQRMAYFIPFENKDMRSYASGVNVAELFAANVVGIVTGRDKLCIQNTRNNVESILKDFQSKEAEQLRCRYNLGEDVQDWTVQAAKDDVETQDGEITQISYRPFDNRWTYYTGRSKGFHCRPRGNIMRNFVKSDIENIGMCFTRTDKSQNEYSMIFVTDKITESCILTTQTAGIATIAPLYLYDEIGGEWTPNLAPAELTRLTEHMAEKPAPIEIFDYIYGILYDPVYRERFNELLKRDFPRVPIINREEDKDNPDAFYVSPEKFGAYVAAGSRLRKLHLMQINVPAQLAIEPNTSDNMEIGAIKYKDGVLRLNANKRILGISEDVWNYRIGGYQVLDKWFKSHKGEAFNFDAFEHISNVAGLLAETIKIQHFRLT